MGYTPHRDASPFCVTGHAKQRAVLVSGRAAGHLAGGRVEAAFALAARTLAACPRVSTGQQPYVGDGRALAAEHPPGAAGEVQRFHAVASVCLELGDRHRPHRPCRAPGACHPTPGGGTTSLIRKGPGPACRRCAASSRPAGQARPSRPLAVR
ncbi:hypothetical protein CD934_00050 [Streptomyces calvus]|uniref:Uncharacterized protein n=1 Tax=Streptomyces calvus TaxID=67282 RepID=A0A514JIW3_9ACTN|nr:hypothetical protein CD934_00050 [Streptomyces calvus]